MPDFLKAGTEIDEMGLTEVAKLVFKMSSKIKGVLFTQYLLP